MSGTTRVPALIVEALSEAPAAVPVQVPAVVVEVLSEAQSIPVRTFALIIEVVGEGEVSPASDSAASSDSAAGANSTSTQTASSAATAADETTGDVIVGGVTYDDEVSDAAAPVEDIVAVATAVCAATDNVAGGDALTGSTVVSLAAGADAAVATDTATGSRVYTRTISDSRPARDNLPRPTGTRIRQGATSDASNADVGSSVSAYLVGVAPIAEVAAAGDSASAGAETVSVSAQDSAAGEDAVTQVLEVAAAIADSVGGGEAIAVQAAFVTETDNNSATSDDLGLDGQSIYRVVASDVAAAVDAPGSVLQGVAALDETVEAADAVEAPAVWLGAIVEGQAASDAATGEFDVPAGFADDAEADDEISAEVVALAVVSDFATAGGFFNDNAQFRRRIVWIS